MINIVIAEDEVFLRKNIVKIINLSDDFLVVGEAGNGEKALELIKENNVDILLSDIVMPIMDGIELSKNALEYNPNIKVLLLTCIDDFEYAREAIKIGVSDYFLKMDTEPEQIISKLNKLKIEIEKEKNIKLNSEIKSSEDYKKIINNSLSSILWNMVPKNSKNIEKINGYKLEIFDNPYNIGILKMNELKKWKDIFSFEELKLIDFSIMNILEDILFVDNGLAIKKDNGEYILFISLKDLVSEKSKRKKAEDILYKINDISKDIFKITFSLIISKPITNLKNIKKEYDALEVFRKKTFYCPNGSVIWFSELNEKEFKDNINIEHFNIYYDKKTIKEIFDNIIDYCKTNEIEESKCKSIIIENITKLFELFKEKGYSENVIYEVYESNIYKDIYNCDNIFCLNTLLNEFIEKLFSEKLKIVKEKYKESDFEKIEQYIKRNFQKEITLSKISKIFGYNASYISAIFKEKTGENFVDYIAHERIRSAKEYLSNSSYKLFEIGQKVGYSNPQYFSKVFKKYVGMSPRHYRIKNKKRN